MSSPRLPTGDEKARMVEGMFDRIADRYDLLNRLMTFGMDVRWRRRTVRELRPGPAARVADLACGTGDLCRALHAAGYRPVGIDFSEGMLSRARTRAPLVRGDITKLPLRDGSMDAVTCGFAMRNVADLQALFAECARVLRVGGRTALLETSQPGHPLMRAGHAVYTRRVVPMIGGLLSDREAYTYLPESSAYLPGGDELVEMLRAAGFGGVRRIPLSGGVAQLLVGTRS